MKVQIKGVVEQTRNPKFQKINAVGSPVYHVGLEGQPELVGKTVTVTVEVTP